MSAPPISMRKLKDLLRLKYEAGLSQRQIARALRLSLGVVNKYLHAAQASGLTWPLPEDITEAQLRRRLFPSQYEALDLPALSPLPAQAYEFAEWKQARVHIDYHIKVYGHFYSVPHSLVTRQVEAHVTAMTIEIFHQNQRVASHVRAADGRGGHTTLPDHMPSHHRAYSEWSPGRFLNRLPVRDCGLCVIILFASSRL